MKKHLKKYFFGNFQIFEKKIKNLKSKNFQKSKMLIFSEIFGFQNFQNSYVHFFLIWKFSKNKKVKSVFHFDKILFFVRVFFGTRYGHLVCRNHDLGSLTPSEHLHPESVTFFWTKFALSATSPGGFCWNIVIVTFPWYSPDQRKKRLIVETLCYCE